MTSYCNIIQTRCDHYVVRQMGVGGGVLIYIIYHQQSGQRQGGVTSIFLIKKMTYIPYNNNTIQRQYNDIAITTCQGLLLRRLLDGSLPSWHQLLGFVIDYSARKTLVLCWHWPPVSPIMMILQSIQFHYLAALAFAVGSENYEHNLSYKENNFEDCYDGGEDDDCILHVQRIKKTDGDRK